MICSPSLTPSPRSCWPTFPTGPSPRCSSPRSASSECALIPVVFCQYDVLRAALLPCPAPDLALPLHLTLHPHIHTSTLINQAELPDTNSTGIDIFGSPVLRADAITTLRLGAISLAGPKTLARGLYGAPTRMPIFISNVTADETFGNNSTCEFTHVYTISRSATCGACVTVGLPHTSAVRSSSAVPTGLTLDQVYNASSRTKFWVSAAPLL